MVITVIDTHCDYCHTETEHKFLGCDECYMDFLEAGNGESMWDDTDCSHLQCLTCDEVVNN